MCPSALCCLFVFVRIHIVPVCTSTGSMGVVPPSCIRVQMIKRRLAWLGWMGAGLPGSIITLQSTSSQDCTQMKSA